MNRRDNRYYKRTIDSQNEVVKFEMQNQRFTESDFDIFQIPGLNTRMAAIQKSIQPKFLQLSPAIAEFLTQTLAEPFYVHIAKHARRTVHPPDQTWVAWSTNKRGYKPYPHFQLGMNQHALLIRFSIFQEYKQKKAFSMQLLEHLPTIWPTLPNHFLLSEDHTKEMANRIGAIGMDEMKEKCKRLGQIKKTEFLCGIQIPRQTAKTLTFTKLIEQVKKTFRSLLPLYQLAQISEISALQS